MHNPITRAKDATVHGSQPAQIHGRNKPSMVDKVREVVGGGGHGSHHGELTTGHREGVATGHQGGPSIVEKVKEAVTSHHQHNTRGNAYGQHGHNPSIVDKVKRAL